MKILSQRDPMWSNKKLGISNLTVGRYGCTTTAISMLSSLFGSYVDPGVCAEKVLKYTRDGLIIWQSVDNIKNIHFVERLYGQNDEKIRAAIKDRNMGVILQVNHGQHWVTAIRPYFFSRNDYIVYDPWDGKQRLAKRKYQNITGAAIFSRK